MAKYLWEKKIPVVGVISHHDVDKTMECWCWISVSGEGYPEENTSPAKLWTKRMQPPCWPNPNRRSASCALAGTLADLKSALTTSAGTSKVNAISINDEELLSSVKDLLSKQNGVSVTGLGFSDGACCKMALALSSMLQQHMTTGLQGNNLQYNVDDYGTVLAHAHGVGLSLPQLIK
jgi:hypothetical protein